MLARRRRAKTNQQTRNSKHCVHFKRRIDPSSSPFAVVCECEHNACIYRLNIYDEHIYIFNHNLGNNADDGNRTTKLTIRRVKCATKDAVIRNIKKRYRAIRANIESSAKPGLAVLEQQPHITGAPQHSTYLFLLSPQIVYERVCVSVCVFIVCLLFMERASEEHIVLCMRRVKRWASSLYRRAARSEFCFIGVSSSKPSEKLVTKSQVTWITDRTAYNQRADIYRQTRTQHTEILMVEYALKTR